MATLTLNSSPKAVRASRENFARFDKLRINHALAVRSTPALVGKSLKDLTEQELHADKNFIGEVTNFFSLHRTRDLRLLSLLSGQTSV